MTIALVGSAATIAGGGSGAALTPNFGTGETAATNNLLVCYAICAGTATAPGAPTCTNGTWSIAQQATHSVGVSVSIFYFIAGAGGTTNNKPTIPGVTGGYTAGIVVEFSGAVTSSPRDQVGSASTLTSNPTATNGGTDAQAGELVIFAHGMVYNTTGVETQTFACNNGIGTPTNLYTATGGSSTQFETFGYGITTGNGVADNVQVTASTTQAIGGNILAIASFKAPATASIPDLIMAPPHR